MVLGPFAETKGTSGMPGRIYARIQLVRCLSSPTRSGMQDLCLFHVYPRHLMALPTSLPLCLPLAVTAHHVQRVLGHIQPNRRQLFHGRPLLRLDGCSESLHLGTPAAEN